MVIKVAEKWKPGRRRGSATWNGKGEKQDARSCVDSCNS